MQKGGCTSPCCCFFCYKEGGYLSLVMREYYAPQLTRLPVKIVTLVVFFGVFAFGAWASTQVLTLLALLTLLAVFAFGGVGLDAGVRSSFSKVLVVASIRCQ